MHTLATFGCCKLPTPSNLMDVIEHVARYEFMVKPAASVSLINSWIGVGYRPVMCKKCINVCHSPGKVNTLLSFPESYNQLKARTACYLRTVVGNMQHEEFMQFVTESCVCITPDIRVMFNSLSGLARRPIVHTCDCSLELIANKLLQLQWLPRQILVYTDWYWEWIFMAHGRTIDWPANWHDFLLTCLFHNPCMQDWFW